MTTQDNEPLSLLDIGEMAEVVEIAEGTKIRVQGIATKAVLGLFQRFPDLYSLALSGGLSPSKLIEIGPDAIAAIIAAGAGFAGSNQAEEIAARIPIEAQFDVLEAIGRLTFRSGFGPFLERVLALAAAVSLTSRGKAPATISPPPSTISSAPATPPNSSGS